MILLVRQVSYARYMFTRFKLQLHSRGGSRIYKRGGLNQGTNLLGRGVQSTLPSMRSMLELGGSGSMPPQEIFEK